MTSVTSLFSPVEADLCVLTENLKALIGAQHAVLSAAAEHLFAASGKRIRPAIVFLVSRATLPDQGITPGTAAWRNYGNDSYRQSLSR